VRVGGGVGVGVWEQYVQVQTEAAAPLWQTSLGRRAGGRRGQAMRGEGEVGRGEADVGGISS
jgi:hypothetical protein